MTRWDHTLTNPGGETGDATGWTSTTGTLSTEASFTPHSGTYYFYGGITDIMSAYQEVDICSGGVSTYDIDNGNLTFVLGAWCMSYASADMGQLAIRFKNSSREEISTVSNSLWATAYKLLWIPREVYATIPANTRYVDVILNADRISGTNNNAYFDDIYCYTTNFYRAEKIRIEFADVSASNPATGWTEYWNTGDFNGSITTVGALYFDVSALTPCAFTYDSIGSVLNGELRGRVYSKDHRSYGEGLCCRVSGTAGSENGYFVYTSAPDDDITLMKYVNGTPTELASATPSCGAFSGYVNYDIRFQFCGNKFKAKAWESCDLEPSGWDLEYEDNSPYLIAGAAGITNIAYDTWYTYFTYDTLGLYVPTLAQRRPLQHILVR